MKQIIAVLAIILLAGCSVPRSVKEGGPISGYTVSTTHKVLLLNVADGQERGQPPAVGSGQGMVAAMRKVLGSHHVPLTTSPSVSLDAGFDEASRSGLDYVMKTTIILWEDNATAWSGKGDKLSISVELYDTKSHALIAAATHKRVATGATLVSGSPDRFMDEVAAGALGQIYGWVAKE